MNKKFSTRENVIKLNKYHTQSMRYLKRDFFLLVFYNLVVTYLDNSLSNSDNGVRVCSSATTF